LNSKALRTIDLENKKLLKRLCRFVAAAICLTFLMMPRHSHAINLSAELTAGYDSNPALSDPADDSGFSVYALRVDHYFSLSEDLSLDVSVGGR